MTVTFTSAFTLHMRETLKFMSNVILLSDEGKEKFANRNKMIYNETLSVTEISLTVTKQ